MSDLLNRRPETGAFFARDRAWHPPGLTPGYKTSVLRSPQKALLSLDGTLSETTGPVFGHSILGELDNDLIHNFARPGESAIGERIIVHGRVLDERARPVAGALLAALGHDEEVAMHVRATVNTGATREDIGEALLHVAIYAGVPAATRAIKIAKHVFEEMDAEKAA